MASYSDNIAATSQLKIRHWSNGCYGEPMQLCSGHDGDYKKGLRGGVRISGDGF